MGLAVFLGGLFSSGASGKVLRKLHVLAHGEIVICLPLAYFCENLMHWLTCCKEIPACFFFPPGSEK